MSEKARSDLEKSKDYQYIQKYISKYKAEGFDFAEIYYPDYLPDSFEKLQGLLASKGYPLNSDDLSAMLYSEATIQYYPEFKERILNNQPQDLNNFIANLLEFYGEDFEDSEGWFARLLKEQNVSFEGYTGYAGTSADEAIEVYIRNRDLKLFEKQLDMVQQVSVPVLDEMTGHEFETFLLKLFNKMGYVADQTKLSGDQGADLILKKHGVKYVAQAKRYSHKVTNKAIQEVTAAIRYYNADKGIVITTNFFTKSAKELAKRNNIELVERPELEKLIKLIY